MRVRTLDLPTLQREGVRDLLLKTGGQVEVLASRPDVIEKLHDLTEGEPLLLRLYVEDLWQRCDEVNCLTLDGLARIKPGFGGYFEHWLKRQREAWAVETAKVNEDVLNAYLAVLACARGPLTADDLAELARRAHDVKPSLRIEGDLHPIRRFVTGAGRHADDTDAGYILSHPKLGEYLREEHFDHRAVAQTRQAFADWGHEVVQQANRKALQPAAVPSYLLLYLGQHLCDVGAPPGAFMEMVEEGWLRAWEAFEGGYRGFSQDVRRAAEAAARQTTKDEPRWAWRLRCQLILSSIGMIGSQITGRLLVECVRSELIPPSQALHWLEYQPDEPRAWALGALAPHLPEALLDKALRAAKAIEDEGRRAEVLVALAPRLLAAERAEGLLDEALRAARAIKDERGCAEVLVALAPHLLEAERGEALAEPLRAPKAIEHETDFGGWMNWFAPHLPRALLDEAQRTAAEIGGAWSKTWELAPKDLLINQLCQEMLWIPDRRRDGPDRLMKHVWSLGPLAPYLPEAERTEALAAALGAARAIGDEWYHVHALVALAPHLPEAERAETLAEAGQAAQAIISRDHFTWRWSESIKTLVALAPHLPEVERAEALAEALQAAKANEDVGDRAEALLALAPQLLEPVRAEARQEIKAIGKLNRIAEALFALAQYLPKAERAEAFAEARRAAKAIGDDKIRAGALVALAPYLPEAERAEALAEVRRTAQAIWGGWSRVEVQYEWGDAKTLVALAPYLPEAERAEALAEVRRTAQAIWGGRNRAEAPEGFGDAMRLVALAQHLPVAERSEALAEALRAVQAIGDGCGKALGMLAPHLPEALQERALVNFTQRGGRIRRSDFLFQLPAFYETVARLDGPTGLREIKRAIKDTTRWFP